MVSKNEKHLATFRIVLLALSLSTYLNPIICIEPLQNRSIYIYNLLLPFLLLIKPAER